MSKIRVADLVAEHIHQQGVKHVFMVAGGGMMFLTDGLAQHPHLEVVSNHHEQASAMGAVAYARENNNLGVAFFTTGCGGTNSLTGVLTGWQDSIPSLFISGQVKRSDTTHLSKLPLRQLGVQEVDMVAIMKNVTKYAVMIDDPRMISYHLEKATYLARSGRPGPVWLDIPLDIQGAMVEESELNHFSPDELTPGYKTVVSQEEMKEVLVLLRTSKRPVIIAGGGIRLANATQLLRQAAERHAIPVVATYMAIDALHGTHPFYVGSIGTRGTRAGNFAMQNADLILALGSRLPVTATGYDYKMFAREAQVVVVDIDPVEHQKNTVHIEKFINGDLKDFLNKMVGAEPLSTGDWPVICRGWKERYPACLPEYANDERVNMFYFTQLLSRLMKPGSVVLPDGGSSYYVLSQALSLSEGQRFITSGGQGEMGFALPAVVGVSFARDKGEAIAVTGDGALQMNVHELQTISHHKLPIKLFVWNNDGYLSIRATQSKYFNNRFIGTDSTSGISFPPLKKLADAYGIPYFLIASTRELADGLDKVLSMKGPVLCEVLCIRDQEVMPVAASMKREDGTMVSKPLEDMAPFLDREEFLANMIVKPLDEN